MKIKNVLTYFIVLVLTMSCSSDDTDNLPDSKNKKIVGEWTLTKYIEQNSERESIKVNYINMANICSSYFIEFHQNNNITTIYNEYTNGECFLKTGESTWALAEHGPFINLKSSSPSYTLTNDVLVIDQKVGQEELLENLDQNNFSEKTAYISLVYERKAEIY